MLYMIALIKELDNPFEHYEDKNDAVIVSLKPLIDLQERMKKELKIITQ